MPEQRERQFVLGLAYQAGKNATIKKGADGARDYFTAEELEKAAWAYGSSPREVGIFHKDGTTGHATVVESYIWRGDPWIMKSTDGVDVEVREGDWLLGAILDDTAWAMYKAGKITGWSPQGRARRRRPVQA